MKLKTKTIKADVEKVTARVGNLFVVDTGDGKPLVYIGNVELEKVRSLTITVKPDAPATATIEVQL